MRVIAGEAKGHNLKSLKGYLTRPTLDRVREAVFNVIGTRVSNAVFLDLFAGTGAIGIEALSRGTQECYFNDNNKKTCEIIKLNLAHCKLEEKGRIFCFDALKLIPMLQQSNPRLCFDLVYIDPPYEADLYEPVLTMLDISSLINTNSLIITETNRKKNLPNEFTNLKIYKKSNYGDTTIWYYNYS